MVRKVEAVYENGVLRPLRSLEGIAEHAQVRLTIESTDPAENGFGDCVGIMPDEDAEDMRRIVDSEFSLGKDWLRAEEDAPWEGF